MIFFIGDSAHKKRSLTAVFLPSSPVVSRQGADARVCGCLHRRQLLPRHRWPADRPCAQAERLLHLRPEAAGALLHRRTSGGKKRAEDTDVCAVLFMSLRIKACFFLVYLHYNCQELGKIIISFDTVATLFPQRVLLVYAFVSFVALESNQASKLYLYSTFITEV